MMNSTASIPHGGSVRGTEQTLSTQHRHHTVAAPAVTLPGARDELPVAGNQHPSHSISGKELWKRLLPRGNQESAIANLAARALNVGWAPVLAPGLKEINDVPHHVEFLCKVIDRFASLDSHIQDATRRNGKFSENLGIVETEINKTLTSLNVAKDTIIKLGSLPKHVRTDSKDSITGMKDSVKVLKFQLDCLEGQNIPKHIADQATDLAKDKKEKHDLERLINTQYLQVQGGIERFEEGQFDQLVTCAGHLAPMKQRWLDFAAKELQRPDLGHDTRMKLLRRLADLPNGWTDPHRSTACELVKTYTASTANAGLSPQERTELEVRMKFVDARIALGKSLEADTDAEPSGAESHRLQRLEGDLDGNKRLWERTRANIDKLEKEFDDIAREFFKTSESEALKKPEALKKTAVETMGKILAEKKVLIAVEQRIENDLPKLDALANAGSVQAAPGSAEKRNAVQDVTDPADEFMPAFEAFKPLLLEVAHNDWKPVFSMFAARSVPAEQAFLKVMQAALNATPARSTGERVKLLALMLEAGISMTAGSHVRAMQILDKELDRTSGKVKARLANSISAARTARIDWVVSELTQNCTHPDKRVQEANRALVSAHMASGDGLRKLKKLVTDLSKEEFIQFVRSLESSKSKGMQKVEKSLINAYVTSKYSIFNRSSAADELENKIAEKAQGATVN